MKTVIGIDPSLRATGTVHGPLGRPVGAVFGSKRVSGHVADRVERYDGLATKIANQVASVQAGLVVLEGQSLGSHSSQTHAVAEFGGVLRLRLLAKCSALFEVPPSSLKLWATGHGHAKKESICESLRSDYGVEFSTDDQYDAYALWRIGWQLLGRDEPRHDGQRRVLEKLKKEFDG